MGPLLRSAETTTQNSPACRSGTAFTPIIFGSKFLLSPFGPSINTKFNGSLTEKIEPNRAMVVGVCRGPGGSAHGRDPIPRIPDCLASSGPLAGTRQGGNTRPRSVCPSHRRRRFRRQEVADRAEVQEAHHEADWARTASSERPNGQPFRPTNAPLEVYDDDANLGDGSANFPVRNRFSPRTSSHPGPRH